MVRAVTLFINRGMKAAFVLQKIALPKHRGDLGVEHTLDFVVLVVIDVFLLRSGKICRIAVHAVKGEAGRIRVRSQKTGIGARNQHPEIGEEIVVNSLGIVGSIQRIQEITEDQQMIGIHYSVTSF